MADIDISESVAVEAITVTDEVSTPALELVPTVYDSIGITESAVSYWSINPSVYDGITVAEAVTTPAFTLKLYRGTSSVTVTLLNGDWDLVQVYKQFANTGVPLKGLILIPGGTDTFSIKDRGENGAYLYYAEISAAVVLVYPGTVVKPFIDYSECTLNTGHKITFVW